MIPNDSQPDFNKNIDDVIKSYDKLATPDTDQNKTTPSVMGEIVKVTINNLGKQSLQPVKPLKEHVSIKKKEPDFNKNNMQEVIRGFGKLANPGAEKTDTRGAKLSIMGHSWAKGWGRHSESMGAAVEATLNNLDLLKRSPNQVSTLKKHVLTIQTKLEDGKTSTFIKRTFAFKTTIAREHAEFKEKIGLLASKLEKMDRENEAERLTKPCEERIFSAKAFFSPEETMQLNASLIQIRSRLANCTSEKEKAQCLDYLTMLDQVVLYPTSLSPVICDVKEGVLRLRPEFKFMEPRSFEEIYLQVQKKWPTEFDKILERGKAETAINELYNNEYGNCVNKIREKSNTDERPQFFLRLEELATNFKNSTAIEGKKENIKFIKCLNHIVDTTFDSGGHKQLKNAILSPNNDSKSFATLYNKANPNGELDRKHQVVIK